MRKLCLSLIGLILISSLAISGCTSTPAPVSTTMQSGLITTNTEAADDLVGVPAGILVYRANISPPNQWGEIRTVDVQLGSGSDIVGVSYRDYIETPSGQTRNNIIDIGQFNSEGVLLLLVLYCNATQVRITLRVLFQQLFGVRVKMRVVNQATGNCW